MNREIHRFSPRGPERRPADVGGARAVSRSTAARLPSGADVFEYRLANARGTEARILTLGATLRVLAVADATGRVDDVVLGFDTVEEYLRGNQYFGATVGRYANRIAKGRFKIAGKSYRLSLNDPPNSEHGGAEGFDRRLWTVEGSGIADGAAALRLSLVSPDGDQGYPGELTVHVTYTLTDRDELRIDYSAVSSAVTILNLTNHSYWNLSGAPGYALCARLTIDADAYTPTDAHQIPTGEIRPVAGSVFDFREPQAVAARIRDGSEPQLVIGRGYDHNFVLRPSGDSLRTAARLEDPRSGRVMELLTTEPGLQLYTGNSLAGGVSGKERRLYRQGDAIALEAQHFPDSPNHPQFPSTVLEAGREWRSTTVYRFLRQSAQMAPAE